MPLGFPAVNDVTSDPIRSDFVAWTAVFRCYSKVTEVSAISRVVGKWKTKGQELSE